MKHRQGCRSGHFAHTLADPGTDTDKNDRISQLARVAQQIRQRS